METGFAGVRPLLLLSLHLYNKNTPHSHFNTSYPTVTLKEMIFTFVPSLLLITDSGVGAGIDSYYEYLMKAYILLGDKVYLKRFNTVRALYSPEINLY